MIVCIIRTYVYMRHFRDVCALCDITEQGVFNSVVDLISSHSRNLLVWCLSCELTVSLSPPPSLRDPQPAGGAVQVLGAAVRVPHPAAAGPAGVLPSQGRDPAGVLAQLGQAGREVLLQDPQLPGAPALQVSARVRRTPALHPEVLV